MTTKQSLRRRFLGGGVASLATAVVLVVLGDSTAVSLLPAAWLAVGGGALLVAGRRERVSLGAATVSWPRIGAFGLAIIALGSSTLGFLQLLEGPDGWGWLTAGIALVVSLLLAFVALECWLGGVGLDEEAFAVE